MALLLAQTNMDRISAVLLKQYHQSSARFVSEACDLWRKEGCVPEDLKLWKVEASFVHRYVVQNRDWRQLSKQKKGQDMSRLKSKIARWNKVRCSFLPSDGHFLKSVGWRTGGRVYSEIFIISWFLLDCWTWVCLLFIFHIVYFSHFSMAIMLNNWGGQIWINHGSIIRDVKISFQVSQSNRNAERAQTDQSWPVDVNHIQSNSEAIWWKVNRLECCKMHCNFPFMWWGRGVHLQPCPVK